MKKKLLLLRSFTEVSSTGKDQIFWEGRKIWKNLPLEIWRNLVRSNFKWKIFSNFVAFSEYPNFTLLQLHWQAWVGKKTYTYINV